MNNRAAYRVGSDQTALLMWLYYYMQAYICSPARMVQKSSERFLFAR